MEKLHLTGLKEEELESFVESCGQRRFRANQLFKQIHSRRLLDFKEMSDLPVNFRDQLRQIAVVSTLRIESKFLSADGTRRYLMKTIDNLPVETVFIPSEGRDTICFSSQSGCPLKCDFCLTARLGLLRSLSAGEIVEQIILVLNDVYGVGVKTPHGTNLVAMGAGEPFLNFENLMKALEIISSKNGLFIVPSRVTVSTAGIVPKIYEFAKLKRRPNLAVSLSATNDALRNKLMPINRRWNIEELMKAVKQVERSLRRGEDLTFEYVLLKHVNDSIHHATELVDLIKRHSLNRVKVNLIPHNTADILSYEPPSEQTILQFQKVLRENGIANYIRRPRGRDIYAACGQLAARTILD
jgi:23S rRNA (adenine2503-C2)-methyltransferase